MSVINENLNRLLKVLVQFSSANVNQLHKAKALTHSPNTTVFHVHFPANLLRIVCFSQEQKVKRTRLLMKAICNKKQSLLKKEVKSSIK